MNSPVFFQLSASRHRRSRVLAAWCAIFGVLNFPLSVSVIRANPANGTVVAGSAAISESGNTLHVMQDSQRAVINWGHFSIAPGEITNFQMPNSSAAILNRVTGGDPSAIMGTMQSNGNVFLINPNGILVGQGAQINVGGFTASTLDISNNLFMQGGELTFSGNSTASVVNQGTIRAIEGNIYLIGATVVNEGTLQAPNGVVGMAAGQEVRLVDSAHPHLVVKPSANSIGGTGVYNKGTIEAMQAELVANGGNVYALAINNEGTIRATGSATVGGRIYLVADNGKIASSGDLIAKKGDEGGDIIAYAGGQEGSSVKISGLVDVSGVNTGGMFYVKAANIDLAGANLQLGGGLLPGTALFSVGPHTVNIDTGPTGGPFLGFPNVNATTVTNKPPDPPTVTVTEVGNDDLLHANGNNVGALSHANFDGFILTSADVSKPFFQSITFDLHTSGQGNPDHTLSTLTFDVYTREPDGNFQHNITTMSVAAWQTYFGGTSQDLNPRFTALNGELIQSITITSVGFDNQHNPVGQVFDEVKQMNSVTDAAPTILVVQKLTDPTLSPQLFNFNVTGPAGFTANFQLSDFNIPVSVPPGTPPPFDVNLYSPPKQFAQVVLPGVYTVTETVANGWFLDGITGTTLAGTPVFGALPAFPIGPGLTGARTVTLNTNDGAQLTFHNTQGAQITVDKVTNPAGDPTLFTFGVTGTTPVTDFQLSDTSTPKTSVVYPGTYTVTEKNIPTGWFLDSVGGAASSVIPVGSGGVGVNGSGTVTVNAGQTTTLTFNNVLGAQIVVNKVTDPSTSLQSFAFNLAGGPNAINQNFNLSNGGSQNSGYVRPGTYTASETVPGTWFLDSIAIAGGTSPSTSPAVLPTGPGGTGSGTVTVGAGQTASLTFNNSEAGTIIVSKSAPADVNQLFNFQVTANSANATPVPGSFDLKDGQSHTITLLHKGEYLVRENVPGGWVNTEIVVVDPTGNTTHLEPLANAQLAAGETISLTYQNELGTPGGHIVVNKLTNPTGDSQQFSFKISNVQDPTDFVTVNLSSLSAPFDTGPLKHADYLVQELVNGNYQPLLNGVTLLPNWDFTSVAITSIGAPIPLPPYDPTNPQQQVHVDLGAAYDLTFTNTKRGEIIVDKQTNPTGDPTAFNFTLNGTNVNQSFSLTDTQAPYSSGFLKPGTYTVSELTAGLPQGWRFTAMSIDGVVFNNPNATVTLNPGATINMAFGNANLDGLPSSVSPLAFFRWDPIYPDGVGSGVELFGFESMRKHLERAVPGEIAGDSSFHAFGPPGPPASGGGEAP